MTFLIVLGALIFLMFVAYRGYSVILFAPVAAMLAVLLTHPTATPAIFTGLYSRAADERARREKGGRLTKRDVD